MFCSFVLFGIKIGVINLLIGGVSMLEAALC